MTDPIRHLARIIARLNQRRRRHLISDAQWYILVGRVLAEFTE